MNGCILFVAVGPDPGLGPGLVIEVGHVPILGVLPDLALAAGTGGGAAPAPSHLVEMSGGGVTAGPVLEITPEMAQN